MSLDGFIAFEDNSIGRLFDWYEAGDVVIENAGDLPAFHLTQQSADYWLERLESLGCLVVGRVLFDFTDGWHGRHPMDVPVVVLTHEPPSDWSYPGSENFTFVTTGIEDAVAAAQQIAGDKVVSVTAGVIAEQALRAGLLDEIAIDLAPVFLGHGKRYFADLDVETVIGDAIRVIPTEKVTHLLFPVPR